MGRILLEFHVLNHQPIHVGTVVDFLNGWDKKSFYFCVLLCVRH